MKLSLPLSFAARWVPVMVIVAVLYGPARLHAQFDTAGLQEQGDEMSRRVGGFFRKMFYGEDRNDPGYRPQQQRQMPQQGYRTAPPQPRRYQEAPPPPSRRSDDVATPQRPRSNPNSPPTKSASKSKSTSADKPKRKESSSSSEVASRSTVKRTEPVEKPRVKKTEEPESKPVVKRKSYTPPTIAEEDKPKPSKKETEVKAPSGEGKLSKMASKKSTPDTDGISPYSEDHRPGGGTTLLAP